MRVCVLLLLLAGCTAENPWYDPGLAPDPTGARFADLGAPPDFGPAADFAGTCGNVEHAECCVSPSNVYYCNFEMRCWRRQSGQLECGP